MKPLLLALLFAWSAAAEVMLVPRTAGAGGPATGGALVATNGDIFIAVWALESSVIVARVEASGALVKTAQIEAEGWAIEAVVPAGGAFLLLLSSNGQGAVIRLNERAEAEGSEHIVLDGYGFVAASTGDRVLVANASGQAVLLSSQGDVIRAGIDLSTAGGSSSRGRAAAASRDRFIYAWWIDTGEIFATTVSRDGQIASTRRLSSTDDRYMGTIAAASDGDKLIVGWHALYSIEFIAFDEPGTVMTIPIAYGTGMDIVWSGSEYVILAQDEDGLRRIRVDRGVTSQLGNEVVTNDSEWLQWSPRLATAGGRTLATWSMFARCPLDLQLPAQIQMALSWDFGPPQILPFGPGDEIDPVVAAGTGPPLVLWNEVRDRGRLRAAFIEPVPRPVPLTSDPLVKQAVATDGSSYLAAFVAPEANCSLVLKLVAIDAAGRVVSRSTIGGNDFAPPLIPDVKVRPSVAWNGSEYLVAWAVAHAMVGVRVSRSGALIDRAPVSLLASAEPGTLTPHVLWAANQWVLVWWRSFRLELPWHSDPPPEDVISLRTFNRELQPQQAGVITAKGWLPAVATDGTNALIAWHDLDRLHAATFEASGTLRASGEVERHFEIFPAVSAAFARGRFYVLDQDQLYELSDGAIRPVLRLPAAATAPEMASDGNRLIMVWSEATEGGAHRINSTFFTPAGSRRRAVRQRGEELRTQQSQSSAPPSSGSRTIHGSRPE